MESISEKLDEEISDSTSAVSSIKLLGPAKKLAISHNGDIYTLRITANNKLILTK